MSDHLRLMTGYVAVDVDRHRKPGDMRGIREDVQTQSSGLSAEALRADARLIHKLQQPLLQLIIIRVIILFVKGDTQGFLGHQRRFFKSAADTHADHHGGAGVGTRQPYRFQHEIDHALLAVSGAEHFESAHVFAAEAFGSGHDFHPVAGHKLNMEHSGRVVAGVFPK